MHTLLCPTKLDMCYVIMSHNMKEKKLNAINTNSRYMVHSATLLPKGNWLEEKQSCSKPSYLLIHKYFHMLKVKLLLGGGGSGGESCSR